MGFTCGSMGLPKIVRVQIFYLGILAWSVFGLTSLALAKENSLIPEDPKDRVGPGMAELFEPVGRSRSMNPPATICMWAFVGSPILISPKTPRRISSANSARSAVMPAFGTCPCPPSQVRRI